MARHMDAVSLVRLMASPRPAFVLASTPGCDQCESALGKAWDQLAVLTENQLEFEGGVWRLSCEQQPVLCDVIPHVTAATPGDPLFMEWANSSHWRRYSGQLNTQGLVLWVRDTIGAWRASPVEQLRKRPAAARTGAVTVDAHGGTSGVLASEEEEEEVDFDEAVRRLGGEGLGGGANDIGAPLAAALAPLAANATFAAEVWARRPLLLQLPRPIAFGLDDLEAALEAGVFDQGDAGVSWARSRPATAGAAKAEDEEPSCASLVEGSGGTKVQALEPLDSLAALRAELRATPKRTVVRQDGAAAVPKLASLVAAVIETLRLRASANLYISGDGARSALGLHTDFAHVLVVQVLGSKRWRVHAPPPVAFGQANHPLERGKRGDVLSAAEAGEELINEVLQPGHVLLLPAGHPHLADSAHRGADEISLHLTIGLATAPFLMDLHALRLRALAALGAPLDAWDDAPPNALYWELLAPQPHLGFVGRALGAATEPVGYVGPRLVRLLREHEPAKWASHGDEELLQLLDLPASLTATARVAARDAADELTRHRRAAASTQRDGGWHQPASAAAASSAAAGAKLGRVLPNRQLLSRATAGMCGAWAAAGGCFRAKSSSPWRLDAFCPAECDGTLFSPPMLALAATGRAGDGVASRPESSTRAQVELARGHVNFVTEMDASWPAAARPSLLVAALAWHAASIGRVAEAIDALDEVQRSWKPPREASWLPQLLLARLLRRREPAISRALAENTLLKDALADMALLRSGENGGKAARAARAAPRPSELQLMELRALATAPLVNKKEDGEDGGGREGGGKEGGGSGGGPAASTGDGARAAVAAKPRRYSGQTCEEWASDGECETNPSFMRISCAKACGVVAAPPPPTAWTTVLSRSLPPLLDEFRALRVKELLEGIELSEAEDERLEVLWQAHTAECDSIDAELEEAARAPEPPAEDEDEDEDEAQALPEALLAEGGPSAASTGCANVRGDAECEDWAHTGHCLSNPSFMQIQCAKACASCTPPDAADAPLPPEGDDDCEHVHYMLRYGSDGLKPEQIAHFWTMAERLCPKEFPKAAAEAAEVTEAAAEATKAVEAAGAPPDALAVSGGCPEPGRGLAPPAALLLVIPFEQGCGVPPGSARSCGQFSNVLSSLLQALALSRAMCRTLLLPGFFVRSAARGLPAARALPGTAAGVSDAFDERWLPTSHFLDIEALAKGFHVRDLAEWVEAQRGARGAACADCVPPQPRLLARDQHAARFAEASAAALNLSFTEVHTREAWPHGYQHGSDDAVSGSDFWRKFNHKYVSAHEPAAPGLLAFGSPVAFGFDQRHLRVDPALRWVRSHVRYVPTVRAEASRVARALFGGAPHLAVQIRRGADRLTGFCYANGVHKPPALKQARTLWGWNMSMPTCYPPVEEVSAQILAAMARWRVGKVYLASDSPRPELFEDALRAHGVPLSTYADAGPAMVPAEHVLLVDQLMCAAAPYFLGNAPSTVTSTIVHEREVRRRSRSTTDFFGFGPRERADFAGSDAY